MPELLTRAAWLAAPVAYLAAELALVTVAARLQNDVVMRHLGRRVYMLLMWPGVCVHELSHALACYFTRTPVSEIRLFGPKQDGDQLVLGYVAHAVPRHRFQRVLVGTAPFFGGTAALYGLLWAAFPSVAGALGHTAGLVLNGGAYLSWLADFTDRLAQANFSWWQGLAAYLMFSVAAHLAPSSRDLKGSSWPLAATLLSLVAAAAPFYFLWPSGLLWGVSHLGRLAAAVTGLMALALVGVSIGLAASLLAALPIVIYRRRARRP